MERMREIQAKEQIANGIYVGIEQAHMNAVKHGFYQKHCELCDYLEDGDVDPAMREEAGRNFVLAQLAKIMTEAGEAVQCIQRGALHEPEFSEELADVVIRVFDLCGFLDIDLSTVVVEKMRRNESRPYLHGKVC